MILISSFAHVEMVPASRKQELSAISICTCLLCKNQRAPSSHESRAMESTSEKQVERRLIRRKEVDGTGTIPNATDHLIFRINALEIQR
jgi:hypothetical protein